MQFPVPQFTDVEDRIIGPLTLKQFGIVFGAGIVVFLGYSATKSILVLIFLALLFGIPAIVLAFGKINGRPIYNSMGYYFKFVTSEKILVFHKQAYSISSADKVRDAEVASRTAEAPVPAPSDPQANLKTVQELLHKTEQAESDIVQRM